MSNQLPHQDNLTVILYNVKDVRLEQTPIQTQLSPHEVLLETDCVGICGSDVHYWQHGRIGNFVLTKPMILGHETSARVCLLGSAVKNLKIGDRVAVEPGEACLSCDLCKRGRYNLCTKMRFHATPPYDGSLRRYFAHPDHLCFRLPNNVNSEFGAMVEPLSVAIHACNRAQLTLGQQVLICGAGPIGLLTLLVVRAFGAKQIAITDINPKRLEMAKQLGADSTILIETGDTGDKVAEKATGSLGIDGFDRTIECSGAESSVRSGILATRSGGVMVIVGHGQRELKVPLTDAAIREVDIRGVFRYANCYQQAIDLIASGKVNLKPLITHRFNLEQAMDAFEATRTGQAIKVIINCKKQ